MERLKANPGGWGVLLGALIALVGTTLSWVSVHNASTGVSTRVTAFDAIGAQSLLLLTFLLIIFGFGVLGSKAGWRIVWAILALVTSGILLAAGLIALFSPVTMAEHFIKVQSYSNVVSAAAGQSQQDAATAAFDAGTLTATVGFGAVLGSIGGALALVGSLLSFRRPKPAE